MMVNEPFLSYLKTFENNKRSDEIIEPEDRNSDKNCNVFSGHHSKY